MLAQWKSIIPYTHDVLSIWNPYAYITPFYLPQSLGFNVTLSSAMYLKSVFSLNTIFRSDFPCHCSRLILHFLSLEYCPSRVTYKFPSLLCPLLSHFVQITVSLAQGYERTPSSPKPRFKSYAYTQAAYVTTSDAPRSPFPSLVSNLYSLFYKHKNFFAPHLPTWLLFYDLEYTLFSLLLQECTLLIMLDIFTWYNFESEIPF